MGGQKGTCESMCTCVCHRLHFCIPTAESFFFFMKCNLHFFVAMSTKSFTLSTPKATSALSSLITFSLLKHYTKQQKKSLSSSWLPARTCESARWEMVAVL